MTEPVRHLFVYGTLLSSLGHPMARLLQSQAHYVGEGWFPGRLYDLGPYPAAIALEKGSSRVWGELYRLAPSSGRLLDILDHYEGCAAGPGEQPHYIRRALQIRLIPGGKNIAWTYLYNRNLTGYRVVNNGDYAGHRKQFRRRARL